MASYFDLADTHFRHLDIERPVGGIGAVIKVCHLGWFRRGIIIAHSDRPGLGFDHNHVFQVHQITAVARGTSCRI